MSIDYALDEANSILHVRPTGALRNEDFAALAKTVDPFIERTGGLKGLLLEVERFPGWDSLTAAIAHLRFVRDHHRRITKVALVTDSSLGDFAEKIAGHFVSAQVQQFPSGQGDEARSWIASEP